MEQRKKLEQCYQCYGCSNKWICNDSSVIPGVKRNSVSSKYKQLSCSEEGYVFSILLTTNNAKSSNVPTTTANGKLLDWESLWTC